MHVGATVVMMAAGFVSAAVSSQIPATGSLGDALATRFGFTPAQGSSAVW